MSKILRSKRLVRELRLKELAALRSKEKNLAAEGYAQNTASKIKTPDKNEMTSKNQGGIVRKCSLKELGTPKILELHHLLVFQGIDTKDDESDGACQICFVATPLPHPAELEIWNAVGAAFGNKVKLITAKGQEQNFKNFISLVEQSASSLNLEAEFLETTKENVTFLAGIENQVKEASLVVGYGEASLYCYQLLKARRGTNFRFAVWQTTPRPAHALPELKWKIQAQSSNALSREKTVRSEVLRNCDMLLTFDKDGATWAYLEEVNAPRIRRLMRGINSSRYSPEKSRQNRDSMRQNFGFSSNDFIYLQMGGLEVETGAIDTIYAFKSMLQSRPEMLKDCKLVFCGTGAASAEVRQLIVHFQLDSLVYFINLNSNDSQQLQGNQLANLLPICDVVIHNPIGPVNGSQINVLDCSNDILSAVASGLTVISNGNGWAGEWLSRYFKLFATGNIHAQARLMHEVREKANKLENVKKAARKAIENEHSFQMAVSELVRTLDSMVASPALDTRKESHKLLDLIEATIKSRQYLKAIDLIQQAFAAPQLNNSTKSQLFRHVADCFVKLGDMESGLQNYTRALDLDPYCAKSYIGLGTIALQTKSYNIAVPQFQKAISLLPNDDMASLGLGLAFEGLGELQEALKWTARACRLNIENTVAIFNLVKISYDLEDFTDAEEIVSYYLEIHNHDVNMMFTLAGLCYKTEKFGVATSIAENILKLDPMNGRAHSLLQQINKKTSTAKRA